MARDRFAQRHEGELYDLLCLLMIGGCVWLVGRELRLFDTIIAFAVRKGLTDLVMLCCFMSFGLCVAAVFRSNKLRNAVRARDIAQLEAASVARHDSMTGLANRRYFKELLDRRLSQGEQGNSTAVLLLDLDRFKPINDIHGHAAGDAVLCTVADRLRALLPTGSFAARLGGDEFAIVLDFEHDIEVVSRISAEIIAYLSRPIAWGTSQLEICGTIGISLKTGSEFDTDMLLHAADVAMYEGKKEGRGTYRFFRKEMDETLKARAKLEHELRIGIDSGQFEPFFQPLVSLVDKELTGFEILARWRHPTRGLLAPEHFISVAEETGMIGDLCWSLLRRACLDAQSWPPTLQLAVNISPHQLQDRRLPEHIMAILEETGFAPERLEVEITETALIADLEAARSALLALRKLGIRIALDDFGTGYSSLYHLSELKFDKLKIDRSYVSSLADGDERSKLVDAIITLGASLGMRTTAEGIETASSLKWLVGQGCTYGQGYFFGKPMSKAVVDVWVQDRSGISPALIEDVAA